MAVSPATTPAKTNDQITAGPAMGTASDSTKKIPVPIVAPIPIAESGRSPMVRWELATAGVRAGLPGHLPDRLASQDLFSQRCHGSSGHQSGMHTGGREAVSVAE